MSRAMRARTTVVLAGGFAALTLAATIASAQRLAYRDPQLHAAAETAAAIVALLAAALLRERVLSASLGALAVQSLLAAATPAGPWPPALAGLAAALLAALAAWLPARGMRRPEWAAPAGAAALSAAAAAAGGLAAAEVAAMLAFAVAARGFARRGAETRWLLAGTLAAAFSCLSAALLGAVAPDALTAGDALRLASLAALLAGAAAHARATHRAAVAAAVADERTRIAQDLHDDTAQDLAYIVQYCRGLAENEDPPEGLEHVIEAARRALDSSRHAIGTLMRPTDEPLAETLARAAQEVAEREGVSVDVVSGADVHAPAEARDALSRLVREAVTNAVRHGGAQAVRVEIAAEPDCLLSISDDGRGFDDSLAPGAGHFGLSGMERRARSAGGELRIRTQLGSGTQVAVTLR